MHITKLEIENIRALEHFTIELTPEEAPGWHVIIGSNASGKSTVLRSIALALIGPNEAGVLRESWRNWLRSDSKNGSVSVSVAKHEQDMFPVNNNRNNTYDSVVRFYKLNARMASGLKQFVGIKKDKMPIWENESIFFSMSLGPFRRMSFNDIEYDRVFSASPKVAAHISIFVEDIALPAGLEMIQTLHIKALEGDKAAKRLLERVKMFINETNLLPFGANITDVTSERITLQDGEGNEINIQQMSSGYKSVIASILEIVRQMSIVYGEEELAKAINVHKGTISLPGVVSIDEVDSHLHPSWQRDIGYWFTRCFPNVQFFVTTHSPIICRAAKTVWKLPSPGTDEKAGRVSETDLNRLIYGSILDAYGTELFGAVSQSEEGRKAREELAKLNRKSLNRRLNEKDAARMAELRAMLPSRASDTAPE